MTTSIFEKRLSYKPFDYSEITDPLINAMWASHWTHNEFNFKADVQDYHTTLSEQERDVIKRAILLISQVEVAVKSYWSNIGKHLPKPEIADMGAVFGGVEVIHSRAYSEILTKLGLEEEFTTLLENEPVLNRVTYLNKYVDRVYADDRKQFLYSLILSDSTATRLSSRTPPTWCSTHPRKRTCTLRAAWHWSIRSVLSTLSCSTLTLSHASGRKHKWHSTQSTA
jgi:ribonucleotide reductase beta subunit family protein with ferritin-like domain